MNSLTVLLLVLFCGLMLAEDAVDPQTEITGDFHETFFPDMFQLLKEFGAMKEKLTAMETRLEKAENKVLQSNKGLTKVVFSAAIGGDVGALGPFNSHTTVIYKKVMSNVGNAYNQFTGIFTAPVAGVYFISFFFHAGGEHEAKLFLFKNNDLIAMTHDHSSQSDTADNGGNVVFLQLQQGDQVFVQLPANSHVWGYDHHTTFSGFLVTET